MKSDERNPDSFTRNLLVNVLADCGEDPDKLECLSLLELIDCTLEMSMRDAGQFTIFMMRLLINADGAAGMLALRLEHSEVEREKLREHIEGLGEALRTSERERAVLQHFLSLAHRHPGLEALRKFLTSFKCESCLDELLDAGIDSIEKLKVAARTKYALRKAGIGVPVAALIRRHLRTV